MGNKHNALSMNPVFLLMGLYFFANLYSFFLAVNGGGIRVDQLLLTFNENDAVSAFILIAFSLFFLFFIYKLNSACPVVSSCTLSSRWGWGVLIFQLLYVINSQYYGVNIAGVEDGVRASPYKFIFTLIDPDTLFLVVAIFLRSSKLFWINTLVYLCSSFIRGWGGGFVLVPVLLLCRYYPVKLKYCIALFFIFSLLFLASPFLIEIKWLIRSGSDTALFGSNVLARGYGVSLLDTTEYIVNRFQMFGHVALLVEQSSSVTKAYSEGCFIPYWADGLPQWAVLKLSGIEIIQLNRYMVLSYFDSYNSAYSTNPGLAGWVAVLGGSAVFFVLYVTCIVFFPAYIARKYAGVPMFLLLYCFVFVWLFYGWIGAYFNFILYFFVVLFFSRISVWSLYRNLYCRS